MSGPTRACRRRRSFFDDGLTFCRSRAATEAQDDIQKEKMIRKSVKTF